MHSNILGSHLAKPSDQSLAINVTQDPATSAVVFKARPLAPELKSSAALSATPFPPSLKPLRRKPHSFKVSRYKYQILTSLCDDNSVQSTSIASNQTGTISIASGSISNCTVTPATGQNTIGCVTTRSAAGLRRKVAACTPCRGHVVLPPCLGSDQHRWFGGTDTPDLTTWGRTAHGTLPLRATLLYINICGAFTGVQSLFEPSCSSVAPNCSAAVPPYT
ncbi:hypothetical protein DFH08DRAFT_819633 [Mycena albidolilacea]|uniref:Uncharacterized protein n=1 Tax=Mycena albidolilacea TaxID=1033008 RepID=A0AAD7EGC0_9AGAR|nr:hypothetical protein DFH08DRAFT_819633 [Mycena albidolilacea]